MSGAPRERLLFQAKNAPWKSLANMHVPNAHTGKCTPSQGCSKKYFPIQNSLSLGCFWGEDTLAQIVGLYFYIESKGFPSAYTRRELGQDKLEVRGYDIILELLSPWFKTTTRMILVFISRWLLSRYPIPIITELFSWYAGKGLVLLLKLNAS